MMEKTLVQTALNAAKSAYAPYSGYCVGAALLTSEGKIYTGCNIENASYTPTVCAERVAFFKAVSEGERSFSMIAVVGGKDAKCSDFFMPCGVCRQVMMEFCSKDFRIIAGREDGQYKIYTLSELLPHAFGKEDLKI